jgi:hypothetical protein
MRIYLIVDQEVHSSLIQGHVGSDRPHKHEGDASLSSKETGNAEIY